jgi:hypothetical protein
MKDTEVLSEDPELLYYFKKFLSEDSETIFNSITILENIFYAFQENP